MDSGALTILEYCFLALVYLFLFRVVRTVLAELKPGRIPVPAAAVAEAAPVAAMAPSRREKSGRRWELVIVEPSSRSGESFSLGEELSVGRGAGCAVVLADDTFVSTVHARIFMRGNDPYVEDLGSTNGTFVNEQKLAAPAMVQPGDRIRIGTTVLELRR
jgi:hypothetical protein